MSNTPQSNKRIAKNTLLLYVRMLFSILVSLYTSRVVLQVLGVEDYGIYGIVGGVVAMLGFLNSSMSGATSRFLTFELGRGDKERLANTFSSAFIAHLLIAGVVLLLAETVGLWFLCNKLVIPEERMAAAHIVYQLSVLSSIITITQVPYNACLIAHEKLDVYAYVEILNVTLKLAIVFMLQWFDYDKLVLYAVLTLAVSVSIAMLYRGYCIYHFVESKFHWVWQKEYLRPLLSFSSWDLYGNGCVTISQQGQNFLINIFFGIALNAAGAIATTVSGVVKGLAYNVILAYRPVIIKLYAQNKIEEMATMMLTASKIVSYIFGIIAIPLIFEMDDVLMLWLGKVPAYASIFCRIILIFTTFNILSLIQGVAIHATGNIKRISFISGSFFLLAIPLQYIAYKLQSPPESAYVIAGVMQFFTLASNVLIVKHNIPTMPVMRTVKTIVLITFVVLVDCFLINLTITPIGGGIIGIVVAIIANASLLSLLMFLFVLTRQERGMLSAKVRNVFYHR